MKTSTLLSRISGSPSRKRRKRKLQSQAPALERLEARQMLTASMMWEGDTLRVQGSDNDDFIAVQQDELGTKLFTEDTFFAEYDGRSLSEAASIVVSGGGGNDVLVSYQSETPVTLNGNIGNDVLFSTERNDTLVGGDGIDWMYQQGNIESDEGTFGISQLTFDSEELTVEAQLDERGRVELQIDIDGDAALGSRVFDVTGSAQVNHSGVTVSASANVESWADAFDIDGFDLTDTSLTLEAGHDVLAGDGYSVELTSNLDISETSIAIEGRVDVTDELTTAAFTGTVADWDQAFGIPGLDLQNGRLAGVGTATADGEHSLQIGLDAELDVQGTVLDVTGQVDLDADSIDAAFSGSIEDGTDAFGIAGLHLHEGEVSVAAASDRKEERELHIGILADLNLRGTSVDVSGEIEVTPDWVDAVFSGSVADWDDAFGIGGFNLTESSVTVQATSNNTDGGQLSVDLLGEMDVRGSDLQVAGSLDIRPGQVSGHLVGSGSNTWKNAFGLKGLDLKNPTIGVQAVADDNSGNSLNIDLSADMQLLGTDFDVAGQVQVDSDTVSGSLTGRLGGSWTSALGIDGLQLHETAITVAGSNGPDGSEVEFGITAGMDLFGIDVEVAGTATSTADGLKTTLSGTVNGEWINAFGVPGLDLNNTALSLNSDGASDGGTDSKGLQIGIDTDMRLFGDYIDMIGEVHFGPSGVDLSFSPPASMNFADMLGIDGFSLDNADLTVTAGIEGIAVAIDSTMDFGNVDVDFTGEIAVSQDEVQASLTGRVAVWDNAFEIPGLNLNDVVLTLGAETGAGGASLFIGLGAGIEIGSSELTVAGLVGLGTTGWEVAFRGSVDSLTSDDLIDFANTLNESSDPNATPIPDGTLGDLELREAFINFAPKGGNEDLGITDGIAIGGDFYDDGELLAGGEFNVDLLNRVFEVELEIPQMDLGPVDLTDVIVDIRMAPIDSHFRVAGTATLMGAEVSLHGEVSGDKILLRGTAEINVQGMNAEATFTVDNSGVRFEASVGLAAINQLTGLATQHIRAAANFSQGMIDEAQEAVDSAKAGMNKLKADLAAARAEAQKEVDKVKANIAKAKVVVDAARSAKNHWYNQRKARYSAWRSAVAKTRKASVWKKPYYKAIEAGKYAGYKYSVARYATQVGIYNVASASYKAVVSAAGWALDTAGIEANPNVLRLKGLLALSFVGVEGAELILDGLEEANQGLLKALDFADSLKVNRITIAGGVGSNTGVSVSVELSVGGKQHILSLDASTEGLKDRLGKELLAALI